MTAESRARVVSAIIVGMLIAWLSFRMAAKHHAEGRQAYLLTQATFFDKSYAHLRAPMHYVVFGVLMAFTFVLVYEAITFVVRSLLNRGADGAQGKNASSLVP